MSNLVILTKFKLRLANSPFGKTEIFERFLESKIEST